MPDTQTFQSETTGHPVSAAGYPVRPINPWKAWQAFQGLVRNKEDTRYVFAFFENVNGRSYTKFYERFTASDYGQSILADREQVGRVLNDRATLESYGPGTFAAAYLDYLDSEDLKPEGVFEAHWAQAPREMAAMRDNWPGLYAVSYMMSLTHDLYHVLSGYSRDPLGEALLLVFTGTQTNGRGPKWLGRLAGLRLRYEIPSWPVGRMMAEAKRNALAATPFYTTDLTALLPLPLEEARARLKVNPPQLYRDTLAAYDGPAPVAVKA